MENEMISFLNRSLFIVFSETEDFVKRTAMYGISGALGCRLVSPFNWEGLSIPNIPNNAFISSAFAAIGHQFIKPKDDLIKKAAVITFSLALFSLALSVSPFRWKDLCTVSFFNSAFVTLGYKFMALLTKDILPN